MVKKRVVKKKYNKIDIWAFVVSGIAFLGVVGLICGMGVILVLLRDKPKFSASDFDQSESSVVYDAKGEEVANLGTVIRQNVEYEEIPNCVIDAFVAVEDSRFFEHDGFDIPRFTKAILENIASMSFGQGGSTFTMQLVKNTYFVNDETGSEASRSGVSGVRRKVQEISLSRTLERNRTKQDIFESYVNKLNFGGDSNIRGIQKAAQYYFAKDVTDLNLVEGAMLAGVINAPNYYNPFYNLEKAQERTQEVLYLMNYHGYISDEEYKLAKTVNVANLVSDPYTISGDYDGVPYQAYIDAVVNEVIDLTGLDPYTTTMHIYTYMNRNVQAAMDDIEGQGNEDYLAFPDDYIECASVCVENSTGHVIGILGGRNYARGGQLLLNHATEQYKQPGSSIKPILDYCLAFENLGWATSHVLTDKPMYMDSSKQNLVYNDSGTYIGDVTIREACGRSINTIAIQTLQKVLDKKNYEYVVNYTTSLGYDFTLDSFNVQYGVGGSTCEVTPFQHASAYAGIMNLGNYNTPHTVSRIEFTNGKSPYVVENKSQQVVSEAAAYITTDIMKSNVNSFGGSYDVIKSDDYQVYGKTGTTDWGNSGKEYGIPSGAVKDTWLVAATSEYTTATWVGYEKAVAGQPSYVKQDYYYSRPQAKIAHTILDACYNYCSNKPGKIEKPDGVSTITHIIGTWPYASTNIDGVALNEELVTTGLIKSDSVKLVSLDTPSLKDLASASAKFDSNGLLELTWAQYPDKEATQSISNEKDNTLTKSDGEVIMEAKGRVLFDYTWIYGPVKYCADIYADGTKIQSVESSDASKAYALNVSPGSSITVDMYYKYEYASNKSNVITAKAGTVTTTIKLPSNASLDELRSWASKYPGIINVVEKKSSNDKDSSLFYRTGDTSKTHITDPIKIEDTSVTYTLELYSGVEYSISLAATTNEANNAVTINAKVSPQDESVEFTYDALSNVEFYPGTNSITIYNNNENAVNVEITAKSEHATKTETFSVPKYKSSN